jgi:hypothetical protein
MRTLLLIGCAAIAAPAGAQMERPSFTLYGGFTSATLHGDSVPGPLHASGFVVGAAVAWRVANHVALQPELQYVQKGDDETDSYSGGVFSTRLDRREVQLGTQGRIQGQPGEDANVQHAAWLKGSVTALSVDRDQR